MAKRMKRNRDQVDREQLNAAMQEFFSRGGRIKKINPVEANSGKEEESHLQEDFALFNEFSPGDNYNDLPFGRSPRLEDFE